MDEIVADRGKCEVREREEQIIAEIQKKKGLFPPETNSREILVVTQHDAETEHSLRDWP